jgi:hypothetical protein
VKPETLDLREGGHAAAAPEPSEHARDHARRAEVRVRPAIAHDPLIPDRWRRYALAPRMWASAERAAAQREAEGRPVPSRVARAEAVVPD